MRLLDRRYLRLALLIPALFSVARSSAAGFVSLNRGRNVHLAVVTRERLCDARVEERSLHVLTVRLVQTTPECGPKGAIVRIPKETIVDVFAQHRLTKRRILARVLLGIGGIAALSAIPLATGEPENWAYVANLYVPALVVSGAWLAVPERRDYLVILSCTDSSQCFLGSHLTAPEVHAFRQ